jgi:hypothetical protein
MNKNLTREKKKYMYIQIKGVIRIRKSKDRQHNDQKKGQKEKQRSIKH